MRRCKKKKIKFKNVVIIFIIIICIIALGISIKNIFNWKVDSDETFEVLREINDIVTVEEVNDNDSIKLVEQKEEIDEFNPYWDYINMNLINVNFEELKRVNNDIKGWIQVNGTNINYPFVQANDNNYYLTHSFNKNYNEAGWVFLDYRNNINNNDKNMIIYAHGRNDKTMFGSIRKILTNGWLKDDDNFVIKLSTENENSLWQLFSVYRIPTTSDYLQINFDDDDDFVSFASMLIDRSAYDFDTKVYENDRILTLSTCYNNDDKIVLHAKMIKKENR